MKNESRIKDIIETVGAVVFPSVMVGITISLGIFAIMDWEFCEETYSRYNTVVVVSSLASAIYFSIKATIYHMEMRYKETNNNRKNAQIIRFRKNQKLFESKSKIS